MDQETIYLDIDEEITSVVDKLKNTETSSLDIVIPKDALLLKSVINLKLLKRQADSLGKEIAIVTQDKVGKKLAEQIGLSVIDKPGQQHQEVRIAEDEPETGKEVVEFKKTKSKKEKSFEKSETEEDERPEPRKSGIVDETSEVVTAGEHGLKESDDEEEVEVPKEKIGKAKPMGKLAKLKKWAPFIGFGVLALVVIAYIYVPLATVNIKLAAESKKVDFSFTASKSNSVVDTDNMTIPARLISEEKETSSKYAATGKKTVGEKATGKAVIYNNGFDSDPITIIAGTRLVTAANLVFRTTTNVTLPGSYLDAGNIVVTSVEVNLAADQVGDKYNVGSGTEFSLPAIGSSKVYGKSSAALAGGSSREVTYVTQSDVNKAKDDMTQNSSGDFQRAVQDKIQDGERLLDEAIKIEVISATPTVAVNGEATEFELRVKANVKAVVFKDDDLKKLAESVLAQEIGSTKEIVETDSLISEATFVEGDFEKGQMEAKLTGEALVATKLEQEKIKTQLSGDSEAAAIKYLTDLDGVDEVQIKFFPSFYKRVPRIQNHIYLKTTLSEVKK